jgi:cytochrome c553
MPIVAILVFAIAVAVSRLAFAAAGVPADGKAKADAAGCPACHGANGVSAADPIPDLAAQPDLFVQFQLVFFRNGSRKNEVMNPLAKDLSDEDIRNLGAYYASLPPPKPPTAPDEAEEQTQSGERIAKAARCANCHGESFSGVDNIARLGGQREPYLLKALRDFKAGARSGTGLNVMVEVVNPLGDPQLQALAHYFSRLP